MKSKTAYVFCEECDFRNQYDLTAQVINTALDVKKHKETGCKGFLILSGSPKEKEAKA